MRHSGPGRQTMTFAVLFLLVGLLHSIGPLTAKGLADFVFGHTVTTIAGWRLHPYQVIISFGCLFRTAAFLLALPLPGKDRTRRVGALSTTTFTIWDVVPSRPGLWTTKGWF